MTKSPATYFAEGCERGARNAMAAPARLAART